MVPDILRQKLSTYHPDENAIEVINSLPIVFLVGISGAGKDTIKQELLKIPDYHHIITHTTRQPRLNHGVMELSGVDYHFIDFETSEHMVDNYGYVEANIYSSNVYGASVAEFQLARDEGKIAITDLEIQGVSIFMRLAPKTTRPVFLLPPSYEVWQERVSKRYGESNQENDNFALRQQTAKKELEHLLETSYFFPIVNDELQATVKRVDEIAHGAELSNEEKDKAYRLAKDILSHF